MEQRIQGIENRLEHVEKRQDKIEDKHEKHALEFAETKVYVKEIYKKMDAISIALEAMRSSSSSKWEQFFAKALYVVLGIAGTYLATKLNLK